MLVTIQNLQVQYGKQTALQIQKPIAIDSGERIGIIGSNGAGKTTLVRTILGLTHYRGGNHTDQPKAGTDGGPSAAESLCFNHARKGHYGNCSQYGY